MIAIVYITRLLLPSRNGRAKIFDKKNIGNIVSALLLQVT